MSGRDLCAVPVLKEILTTEERYVDDLEKFVELFLRPCEVAVKDKDPVLQNQDLRTLQSCMGVRLS